MDPIHANGSGLTEIWLYDLEVEDISWIITSSFMIFTMQTGFGMLEAGCVSTKNEVNIMMKNVVDIVLGGITYWLFGFAFSFGRSIFNNPFIAFGDFLIDPPISEPLKGSMYTAFLFQMSFASTATTIVSGAMAESLLNTVVYCIPAGWIWGDHGFLKKLGAVDIAGSGPVHLVGGFSAFASALMLGPRLKRYDGGINPLPMGTPVNAVLGLFVIWWGWLAFNSGSTYGLTGEKYKYAARAAVMTMMASFGGGCASIAYTLIKYNGKTKPLDVINGILGSLVSITAGCFLYQGWEAIIIGAIGSILVCSVMPVFDRFGIDDPVGASSVHGIGGMWGVIAVGFFAENPYPLETTQGRSGLLKSGSCYLLGIQCLVVLCLSTWAFTTSVCLLWLINLVVKIRMDENDELIGSDLAEHGFKHTKEGIIQDFNNLDPELSKESIIISEPKLNTKITRPVGARKKINRMLKRIKEKQKKNKILIYTSEHDVRRYKNDNFKRNELKNISRDHNMDDQSLNTSSAWMQ